MNKLIETITSAIAPDADDASKHAGSDACRALLAALEVEPGKPLAPAPMPSSPMVAAVQQLRSAPPTLVLDALIAKLRAHLPQLPEEAPQTVPDATESRLAIPFVPIPQPQGGSDGTV